MPSNSSASLTEEGSLPASPHAAPHELEPAAVEPPHPPEQQTQQSIPLTLETPPRKDLLTSAFDDVILNSAEAVQLADIGVRAMASWADSDDELDRPPVVSGPRIRRDDGVAARREAWDKRQRQDPSSEPSISNVNKDWVYQSQTGSTLSASCMGNPFHCLSLECSDMVVIYAVTGPDATRTRCALSLACRQTSAAVKRLAPLLCITDTDTSHADYGKPTQIQEMKTKIKDSQHALSIHYQHTGHVRPEYAPRPEPVGADERNWEIHSLIEENLHRIQAIRLENLDNPLLETVDTLFWFSFNKAQRVRAQWSMTHHFCNMYNDKFAPKLDRLVLFAQNHIISHPAVRLLASSVPVLREIWLQRVPLDFVRSVSVFNRLWKLHLTSADRPDRKDFTQALSQCKSLEILILEFNTPKLVEPEYEEPPSSRPDGAILPKLKCLKLHDDYKHIIQFDQFCLARIPETAQVIISEDFRFSHKYDDDDEELPMRSEVCDYLTADSPPDSDAQVVVDEARVGALPGGALRAHLMSVLRGARYMAVTDTEFRVGLEFGCEVDFESNSRDVSMGTFSLNLVGRLAGGGEDEAEDEDADADEETPSLNPQPPESYDKSVQECISHYIMNCVASLLPRLACSKQVCKTLFLDGDGPIPDETWRRLFAHLPPGITSLVLEDNLSLVSFHTLLMGRPIFFPQLSSVHFRGCSLHGHPESNKEESDDATEESSHALIARNYPELWLVIGPADDPLASDGSQNEEPSLDTGLKSSAKGTFDDQSRPLVVPEPKYRPITVTSEASVGVDAVRESLFHHVQGNPFNDGGVLNLLYEDGWKNREASELCDERWPWPEDPKIETSLDDKDAFERRWTEDCPQRYAVYDRLARLVVPYY